MKLIFNCSMPRSGSELVQTVIHQNPLIYGSTTSPLLEYQFAARGNYNLPEVKSQNPELMQNAFVTMCKSMASGYYESITNRPIVIDKNRGWSHYFEWVEQWNPNPLMICMVRDMRSIIASMERIYRKTRHLPDGPDNPAQLRGMTVDQRAEHWLNTQPIGLALQRTWDCFQRKVDNKILFVRYEDLCVSPQSTFDKIYDFIGEKRFDHDFNNIVKSVEENDGHFGPYGSHSVAKTIRPHKPSDWLDVLPKEVAQRVSRHAAWYQNQFNY